MSFAPAESEPPLSFDPPDTAIGMNMSVISPPEATVCKYRRAVDALQADPQFDQDDAAQVDMWLAGITPAAHIGRELRALGYEVSNTRIKEHRLGDCNCSVSA